MRETCRDIRMLHTAKRHIQTAVTALRRLHMLIAAVRQLELAAQERRFRETANLLDAVQQLLTHFDSYSSVPRIAELRAVQCLYIYVLFLLICVSVAAHAAFRFTCRLLHLSSRALQMMFKQHLKLLATILLYLQLRKRILICKCCFSFILLSLMNQPQCLKLKLHFCLCCIQQG